MPVPNEYRRIVALLTEGTGNGVLRWHESGREGEVIARLREYSVALSINRLTEMFNAGYDIKSPVTCQLLLPEGMAVDRFDVRPDDADYPVLRALYDTAARKAIKKAEMVREVEAELQAAASGKA